jgi:hypothetical protein
MAISHALTGLSSQSRPGLAARFARRVGGAVRTVMASSITLASSLRRPAAPASTRDPAVAGDLNAPVPPNSSGAAGRPRDAAPVALAEAARSGLLPRVLGRQRQRSGWRRRRSADGDAPFTPKNCPGLSREMCKFLNTPLGDGDPAMARMMFTALEEYFVGLLPADAGAEGAAWVHGVIWGRLGGVLDERGPDCLPAEAAEPAPAAPMDVVSAAAVDAVPDALAHAACVALTDAAPASTTDTAASVAAASPPGAASHAPPYARADLSPDAWPDAGIDAAIDGAPALPEGLLALLATALRGTSHVPPEPLRDAKGATLADNAAVAAIAAAEISPETDVPRTPCLRHRQSLRHRSRLALHGCRSLFHCCRWFLGCWHDFLQRGSRDERRCPLSPPLLC